MSGKTIFFSAGEPSGDQHTARLMQALATRCPDFQFRGFGGPEMRAMGCKLDFELTQLAVVGLVEVLPKLRQFFRVADLATDAFSSGRCDAVVLVDFPGFNWHIAKRAKKYGIPVYYYLPPQLWAWGAWRVKKIRRYVDRVLSVLPFEHQWYLSQGIASTYVGHPFFDAVAEKQLNQQLLGRFEGIKANNRKIVAVLPGSRGHEVKKNWPLMLETIRRLSRSNPDTHFMVAAFRDSQCLWCRDQMTSADASLPIDFFAGRTSEIIESADCAMMVSGSVSLELMARGTPAAVIYRVGRILYTAARAMVRVPSFTLPNLIAEKTIFPEMASVGSPEPAIQFLHDSVARMLTDAKYAAQLHNSLADLGVRYAIPGASQRAADTLLNDLEAASPRGGQVRGRRLELAAA
jgi:lipid-A-disaccharide synthase